MSPRGSQAWPSGGGRSGGSARGGPKVHKFIPCYRRVRQVPLRGRALSPRPSSRLVSPLPCRLCWRGQWLQQPLQGCLRQHDHLPEEEGGAAAAAAGEAAPGPAARAQWADQEDEDRGVGAGLLVLALGVPLGGRSAALCPPTRSSLTSSGWAAARSIPAQRTPGQLYGTMGSRTFCPQSCAAGQRHWRRCPRVVSTPSTSLLLEGGRPRAWRSSFLLILQRASCRQPGGRRLASSTVDTCALLRLPFWMVCRAAMCPMGC